MFWASVKHPNPPIYTPPKEDASGWSKWQLWSLMEAFGPHIHLGSENCFETTIEMIMPITDFDARIELRILAAQLRMRVHVEILCNRAERDIAIETHRALRDLFKSIKYGVHHAEI